MTSVIIILIAVLGASLGSFFNVLIDRLPRGASIVKPPSHCTSCGKSIPFWKNVPILSYILLKGKCSNCGARIHWHHLLVEIATPLLLIGLFLMYGLDLVFFKYAVMFCFLIPIFFIDAFHKIIPLALTLPMSALGFILSLAQAGFDWSMYFMIYVLPSVGLFAMLYLIAWGWEKAFHKEGLGGGDVVLIPAVATYFGIIHIPWVIILACIMGIAYFLAFIRKPQQAFAFGNFIALAAAIWAFLGELTLYRIGLFS